MARFDGRILTVALHALLLGCGRESRQPAPAAVPAPAVAPQATPPSAPDQKAPTTAPKDSAESGVYPWQSGPIAAL